MKKDEAKQIIKAFQRLRRSQIGVKHCSDEGFFHHGKVDEAYKTICNEILFNDMPDVTLYALPGKELEMLQIAEKMKKKIKPLKYKKLKTFATNR